MTSSANLKKIENKKNSGKKNPTLEARSSSEMVAGVRRSMALDADQVQLQKKMRWRQIRLFSGSSNQKLAEEIAKCLGIELSKVDIRQFADGEIGIQVKENVRGKEVFIVQSTCRTESQSVNDNLMELILMVTTCRRASAQLITAVIPYYGYARQDRKLQSRVPISAADVARLLECAGVDRVIAMDLHCGQIQGFFGPRTPSDNLSGSVVALPFFMDLDIDRKNTVVVSPDAGGVSRSKNFRHDLAALGFKCSFAMLIKQRAAANQISCMDLVGDVKGKDCIIVDDMIDTAGTLCKAAAELKRHGAKRIFAFATHGLFSGPALQRITNSHFERVIVCNTVPMREEVRRCPKIVGISVASLLAKSIYCSHFKKSVSKLFDIDNCGGELPHQTPITNDRYVSGKGDEY